MANDDLGLTDQAPSGLNNLGDDDLYSCFVWSSAQESPARGAEGARAGLRAPSPAGGAALGSGPSPSRWPLGGAPTMPPLPALGASTAGVQPELPGPSLVAGLPGAAAAAAVATGVDDGEHTQRGDDEIAEFGELTQRMQQKVPLAPTPAP